MYYIYKCNLKTIICYKEVKYAFKTKKKWEWQRIFYGDYETKRDLMKAVDKQIIDYKKRYPNAKVEAFHNELGAHVYAFDSKKWAIKH